MTIRFSLLYVFKSYWASLIAQLVKNLPAVQEILVQFLGALQYSGLENSLGLQRVGHD